MTRQQVQRDSLDMYLLGLRSFFENLGKNYHAQAKIELNRALERLVELQERERGNSQD